MGFSLNKEQYTFCKATFWGLCYEHGSRAFSSEISPWKRVVHLTIALIEAIPIIGQIASIFETISMKIAYQFYQTTDSQTSLSDRITQLDITEASSISRSTTTNSPHAHNSLNPLLEPLLLQETLPSSPLSPPPVPTDEIPSMPPGNDQAPNLEQEAPTRASVVQIAAEVNELVRTPTFKVPQYSTRTITQALVTIQTHRYYTDDSWFRVPQQPHMYQNLRELYSSYNTFLQERGYDSGLIPISTNDEDVWSLDVTILYPDLFFQVCLERRKGVALRNFVNDWDLSYFFHILGAENSKYGRDLRGEVYQCYNEYLENINRKYGKIPGDNLESLSLNSTFNLSNPELFFSAYSKVFKDIRNEAIILCEEIKGTVGVDEELHKLSATAALIYNPTLDCVRVVTYGYSAPGKLDLWYIPKTDLPNYGPISCLDVQEKFLKKARDHTLSIKYNPGPTTDRTATPSIELFSNHFEEVKPRTDHSKDCEYKSQSAYQKPTVQFLIDMVIDFETLLVEYGGKVSRYYQYPVVTKFNQLITLVEESDIDAVLDALSSKTKVDLFCSLGTIEYNKNLRENNFSRLCYLMKSILSSIDFDLNNNEFLESLINFYPVLIDHSKVYSDSLFKMLKEHLADAPLSDPSKKCVINLGAQLIYNNHTTQLRELLKTFPFLQSEQDLIKICVETCQIESLRILLEEGFEYKPNWPKYFNILCSDPSKPDSDRTLHMNKLSKSQLSKLDLPQLQMEMFNLFFEYGHSVNSSVETPQHISLPLLEYIIRLNSAESSQEMILLLLSCLLKRNVNMTSNVLLKIKQSPQKFATLFPLLVEKGHITSKEADHLLHPSTKLSSRDALLNNLTHYSLLIPAIARRYTSQPTLRDFTTAEKIKALKREVKEYLKAHHDEEIERLYRNFCTDYDALVSSHLVLSLLRNMSQNWRHYPKDPSESLIKLISLWGEGETSTITKVKEIIQNCPSEGRCALWKALRANCLSLISQLDQSPVWQGRRLVCVHGTKLVPDMIKTKALIPLGMIMEEGLVACTGEQCGSILGHNREHLSFSNLDPIHGAAPLTNTLYDTASPVLQSLIYAKQKRGYGTVETTFDLDASRKRVSWNHIKSLISRDYCDIRSIQPIHTDILRLKAWEPEEAANYLGILEIHISEALEDINITTKMSDELKAFQATLRKQIQHPFSEKDKELILARVPILFGTLSKPTYSYHEIVHEFCAWDEVFLKGRVAFGEDIQVVFTDRDHIEYISTYLKPLGIEVLPFETAFALETEVIARREAIKKLSASTAPAAAAVCSTLTQTKISHYLSIEMLPNYGRMLSPEPTYIDDSGTIQPIPRAGHWGDGFTDFPTYQKAVEEGDIPPRIIHGKMHATRTSIGAQILLELYKQIDQIEAENVDPFLLAMAASAHDTERQDESKDHWDTASGKAFGSWLASKGYRKEVVEIYTQALAEKDPEEKGNPYTTLEQRLVHDADCLEILRCILDNPSDFKEEYLAILKYCDEHNRADMKAEALALVKDWLTFIKVTESMTLKTYLEYTPGINYYEEVMKILVGLVQMGKLPTIAKYLTQKMKTAFSASPPSPGMLRILEPVLEKELGIIVRGSSSVAAGVCS